MNTLEDMMMFPMDPFEEDTEIHTKLQNKIVPSPVYLVPAPAPAQLPPERTNNLEFKVTCTQFYSFWFYPTQIQIQTQIQTQFEEVASTSPSGTPPGTPPEIEIKDRDILKDGIFVMDL